MKPRLKLDTQNDIVQVFTQLIAPPPSSYKRGFTYSTRLGDLAKRIETCQKYLHHFIDNTTDKKRRDNAVRLLSIFDWYIHVRAGNKYGEIIINPFCLIEEMDKGINMFWYQSLLTILNRYSSTEAQLHQLMKAAIRKERALVGRLIINFS